jgi:hypothetical protein
MSLLRLSSHLRRLTPYLSLPAKRCFAMLPPFGLYNLNNAGENVYHVEEWKLYKDFTQVIVKGTCKEVQDFHDVYVKNYHTYLRSISSSPVRLEFYDRGWGCNTVLDFPVYDRLMNYAVRQAITYAEDTPTVRENLSWLFRLSVVDPKQMMYALNSLIIIGRTSLAAWLIEQDVIEFRAVPHVYPLRQAICSENYEIAKMIYERYPNRRIPYDELDLIRNDLVGTGKFEWRKARPDMTRPMFAWLLSLPEFKDVGRTQENE